MPNPFRNLPKRASQQSGTSYHHLNPRLQFSESQGMIPCLRQGRLQRNFVFLPTLLKSGANVLVKGRSLSGIPAAQSATGSAQF